MPEDNFILCIPPQRPFLLEVTECASCIFNVTFTVITSLLRISCSPWLCHAASSAVRALVWVAPISCSLIFACRRFSPKSWSCGWFLITFSLLLPESSTASWLAGLYLSPAAKFSEFSFHPPGSRPSRWQSVGLSVAVSPGDETALFPVTCSPPSCTACCDQPCYVSDLLWADLSECCHAASLWPAAAVLILEVLFAGCLAVTASVFFTCLMSHLVRYEDFADMVWKTMNTTKLLKQGFRVISSPLYLLESYTSVT